MSLFQPSTLTFGNAKTQVAQQASKQNTAEFLARAGQSVQKAIQNWNKYNWRWMMVQAADVTASAGVTSLALPYDFKDVYTLSVVSPGRQRVLTGVPRRIYDRVVYDQTLPNDVMGYDLFTQGALGRISIHPVPDTAETIRLKYYRRMWVPCSVTATVAATGGADTALASASAVGGFAGITNGSPIYGLGAGWVMSSTPATAIITSPFTLTVSGANMTASANTSATAGFGGDALALDIPEDFENGIMSWATHHFLSGLGAPEGRLSYYISLSESEFQEARAANERYEDQDISFEIATPPWGRGAY
jgi:hypothetical protein